MAQRGQLEKVLSREELVLLELQGFDKYLQDLTRVQASELLNRIRAREDELAILAVKQSAVDADLIEEVAVTYGLEADKILAVCSCGGALVIMAEAAGGGQYRCNVCNACGFFRGRIRK